MEPEDNIEQIVSTLREIDEAQGSGHLDQAKVAAQRLTDELRTGFKNYTAR